MKRVKIPVAFQLTLDDLAWHNGRDLRSIKHGSRSGIPRDHVVEDYKIVNELGKALDQKILCKLCLADWDKDNVLRGEVGVVNDPYTWNRAEEMDMEYAKACFTEMENSPSIEYAVHTVLHGRYGEDGNLVSQKEIFVNDDEPERVKPTTPEDFGHRLDLFFKIYNSWGFDQELRVFGSPCGIPEYITYDQLLPLNEELYKRGIRYWHSGWANHLSDSELFAPCRYVGRNGEGRAPWNAFDVDPDFLPDAIGEDTDIEGSVVWHWTNLLRYHPQKNLENLDKWVAYCKRQASKFGAMMSRDFVFSANQQLYHRFARLSVEGDVCSVDLTDLLSKPVPDIGNEFYISFKNDFLPITCDGGKISVYEVHEDFKTYKVSYDRPIIKIKSKI